MLLIVAWLTTFRLAAAAEEYLLPDTVIPTHYDVRYVYDVDPATEFSFYGVVDILLYAKKPTSQIRLHAEDYSLGDVTLQGPTTIEVKDASINNTFNFLTIKLNEELQENVNYTLTIPFYGNLKIGLDGVYISTYVNQQTQETEYLIASQFEAISARKGFPCFDEPMYKATFKITIGHHNDYTAVSNMPLEKSSKENKLEQHYSWATIQKRFKKPQSSFTWDEFQVSVPMSTYLVAFVVSKFVYVESPAELSHTKFKIWARKDAISQAAYAATIGPKVLTHFEKFFNVSFPLPKQDMVALPDFSAGAMENWGLITYRETALLYDPKFSSLSNKERVAEVIAHELAHQWFGNLVTMKWWSDLWLNEGFATYVASIGVAAVEPTWGADVNYAVANILALLGLDSLESSHPVVVALDDPKRISEIFDEISYKKGAALIRMMTLFLGEDVFRKALHQYLIKYSYANAEQDDLWQELTDVSLQYGGLQHGGRNITVRDVMHTWTTQAGYPLVTARRGYGDSTVELTQRRYLSAGSKSLSTGSWWVPLRVMCQSEAGRPLDPVEWLAEDEGLQYEHRFEHAAQPDEWILFNPDMIAPYRINYDERNWKLLISTLKSPKYTTIPTLGRVQLLSDSMALSWSNNLDYNITMQLLTYLQREKEYLPLDTGLRGLAKIENVLLRSPDYGAFQKFVRKLITEQYHEAGGLAKKTIINGEDLNSVKLQSLTSAWACSMKVPGCEDNALELFNEWMAMTDPDENNPIPLDLRRTVYCVGVARGGPREWRFVLNRQRRANVAAAREALQRALACSREVWILAQYIEWTITDDSPVRRQDASRVLAEIIGSPVGYYVGKDFVYTRIADLYKAFNGQGRRLGGVFKALLREFTTQRELDEFKEWREKNEEYLSDVKLALSQAVETARINIEWIQNNKKLVVDKLREFSE